jgi:hypothetical protein
MKCAPAIPENIFEPKETPMRPTAATGHATIEAPTNPTNLKRQAKGYSGHSKRTREYIVIALWNGSYFGPGMLKFS